METTHVHVKTDQYKFKSLNEKFELKILFVANGKMSVN